MNRRRKNILIVDDDAEMRSLLTGFLSARGYHVQAVSSGIAALPIASDPPPQDGPDLVISDIQMNPMDGIQLLKHLLASRPELPVVMMSAIGERAHEREVLAIGARRFLAKPFPLAELASAIQQFIGGIDERH